MQIEKIEFGKFYHIFNRGNNSQDIFFEEENYLYFLKLLTKYIFPIADIYCYCLMNNHFHQNKYPQHLSRQLLEISD